MPQAYSYRDGAQAVALSPDKRTIAVGTLFGRIHMFNVSDGRLYLSIDAFGDGQDPLNGFHAIVGAVTFSPDGTLIAAGRGLVSIRETNNGWTRIWRTDNGQEIAKLIGGKEGVRTMAWSSKEDVLVAGDDLTTLLWHVDQPSRVANLVYEFPHGSYSAKFSSKGDLAIASNDKIFVYQ